MNFFELFGIPVEYDINLNALKQRYLSLQQQHHPDRQEAHINQLSANINAAYQTLLQADSRAAYLLSLEQQDHGLDQSIHDFEFLQTALELREQLDEAGSVEHLKQLREDVQQWLSALSREFVIDYRERDWSEARDTVRKMRFFQHVLSDIAQAEDRLEELEFEQYDEF